ncbi:hypothetical protein O181_019994 [Austropuccinia psidii MF-1]|uniref:Uncharacterized protein n=1 Tax=Austropuccinia psidii MF-1 TaxID=1389203 RepID=A0A9Q3GV99_9BASI|nr:hypothetical protein [Austropuccinia psidii MF-1]
MLEKARKNAAKLMEDSFAYAKEKWDKSHFTPNFKVGDLVLVSTNNLNNIKECKKIKESFLGSFVIKALHEDNVVKVELSVEISNNNLNFPVSSIKNYKFVDV